MRGLIGCYTSISMNIPVIANVATTQRCKRCTSDSPGLTSESEVYPGLFAVRGNNAVGVVPFIYWYFIEAFHAENVQHLRR
ncbi:lipopolysaccharide modification acyltransferase [Segatella salivae]|uniref:lipopolysaccharide modification acyltransferase n=1 Tax=Segatella salivae TaxID=228604 RepID=UPI00241D63A5|nr:lipopolysaccharide modification acyltransferase [Segatella salivae]